MAAARLRVQHVPHEHGYVSTLSGTPLSALDPTAAWSPHPALEPEWIDARGDDLDVLHLHFGFEHLRPDDLRRWITAVRRRHVGLVLTVHDIVNPHLGPDAAYDRLLDVVVPAADAVTTLTGGAAREIRRRWGRDAVVHAHPHVVPDSWLERPHQGATTWTVGIHLKSLRANVDLPLVFAVADVLARMPDAVLRVHVHRDVLDPAHPRHDPRLADLADHPGIELRVHDRLGDEELWSDLLTTDLAVLPYRWGTHSGWLEMCHDLGTDVLATDIGFLREQRDIRVVTANPAGERGGSEATGLLGELEGALTRAHADHRAGRRPRRPSAEVRRQELEQVRRVHDRIHLLAARQAR